MDIICPACDTPHVNKRPGSFVCHECLTRLLVSVDEGVKEVIQARSKVVPAGALQVKQQCGCIAHIASKTLCGFCRKFLSTHLCQRCAEQGGGFYQRLPPCPLSCQRSYLFTGDGGDVMVPCGYCANPAKLWDMDEVLVGQWGQTRVLDRITHDGTRIYTTKRIPFVKKVKVCEACQADYREYRRLTQLERGPHAVAFLPV